MLGAIVTVAGREWDEPVRRDIRSRWLRAKGRPDLGSSGWGLAMAGDEEDDMMAVT